MIAVMCILVALSLICVVSTLKMRDKCSEMSSRLTGFEMEMQALRDTYNDCMDLINNVLDHTQSIVDHDEELISALNKAHLEWEMLRDDIRRSRNEV